MKNKKIKKLVLLVVAIITIVGLGGLFAYLSDTDQKTNVFTVGKIDIELTETNWNPSNAQNVLPGQPIPKNPTINNIGRNSAYVYIKVVNPIVQLTSGEGVLFNYTINSGWTQLDQQEKCGYRATTYYYNIALYASNSTNALFDNVTINDFTGEVGEEQILDIYAYGIQSTYLEDGSTIQSIFTDAFTTSLSDTDESCNSVTDCDNNELSTTAPLNLKGLAKIMAKNAYLDNGKSEYVNSCSGVDFSNISSDTNGKGVYEIASTKNDTYPIYYYRGAVDNNNVKFGGFCWKAIRTTDTGGVKMIYNGEPDQDGYCTNTIGTDTQIGSGSFNSYPSSPANIGYMYGNKYNIYSKVSPYMNNVFVYGNDVTYSNGTYTLVDTITGTGTWSTDSTLLSDKHYTCWYNGTTCTSVDYIFRTITNYAYYITLTNGKKIEDAKNEIYSNTTNSTAKDIIDAWYNTNLSSYSSYIEDTVYCSDKSITDIGGWDPNGGDPNTFLNLNPRKRLMISYTPTLTCNRQVDKFTVLPTKGNGSLTYPVGLITSDEVMYAGGDQVTYNQSFYLYNNQKYWTMSPFNFGNVANIIIVSPNGKAETEQSHNSANYRPVISLKSTDIVESGNGTSTNPYVIKTS